MKINPALLVLISLSGALAPGLAVAQATSTGSGQAYPAKPVRVVVPFPPGGAADIVARQVTHNLSAALGAQFIVDNRAGAGGAIGTENVARAAPDARHEEEVVDQERRQRAGREPEQGGNQAHGPGF